jgi:hypothetical protein
MGRNQSGNQSGGQSGSNQPGRGQNR